MWKHVLIVLTGDCYLVSRIFISGSDYNTQLTNVNLDNIKTLSRFLCFTRYSQTWLQRIAWHRSHVFLTTRVRYNRSGFCSAVPYEANICRFFVRNNKNFVIIRIWLFKFMFSRSQSYNRYLLLKKS